MRKVWLYIAILTAGMLIPAMAQAESNYYPTSDLAIWNSSDTETSVVPAAVVIRRHREPYYYRYQPYYNQRHYYYNRHYYPYRYYRYYNYDRPDYYYYRNYRPYYRDYNDRYYDRYYDRDGWYFRFDIR